MTGHVAVLDHGKSRTRVAIFDGSGTQIDEWARSTPIDRSGIYPSEDVEALHPFILDALTAFAQSYDIQTIIPVAHGAAGVLIGADSLVMPVMDYEGHIPRRISEAYERARPAFAETGSPSVPAGLNLGRQVYFMARAYPETFATAQALLTLPQYWGWCLTGVAASEITSLGCHTDLWDIRDGAPSSLAIAEDWTDLLPPLKAAWEPLGPLRPGIAGATGLSPETMVLTGLHDSNASLVPYFTEDKAPFAVVSSGTWTIVMHVGGDVACLDQTADMLANIDIYGRPTPSARFMGGREYAAIAGDDTPATLEIAKKVIEAKVFALPAFSAQGGPWAGQPGTIEGDLPLFPGARSALASLYCALVTDDLLDRLGVIGPVHVDGPFATNTVWLTAMAALRPEVRPSEGASPAAGAAQLALGTSSNRTQPPFHRQTIAMAAYRERWRDRLKARGLLA